MGSFGLGRTFKGPLVPPPMDRNISNSIRALQVLFNLAWETSMDEVLWAIYASTFQAHFKNDLLPSLHLPPFSLKLLNLV